MPPRTWWPRRSSATRSDRSQGAVIPGAVSFKLYDTYGLALDEQEEMAREHGLAIDREGFESEMERQRERARASWKGAGKGAVVARVSGAAGAGRTKFLGYAETEAAARVVGLLVDRELVDQVPAGAKAELVLDQTPFYAESGGQVGDRGALYSADRRKSGGCRGRFPRRSRADGAPHCDARAHAHGRCAARRGGRAVARRHAPQPHRHAPAARLAAPGAGHARQAGRQRGGTRAPALRFHALRRHGPRRKSRKSSGS